MTVRELQAMLVAAEGAERRAASLVSHIGPAADPGAIRRAFDVLLATRVLCAQGAAALQAALIAIALGDGESTSLEEQARQLEAQVGERRQRSGLTALMAERESLQQQIEAAQRETAQAAAEAAAHQQAIADLNEAIAEVPQ